MEKLINDKIKELTDNGKLDEIATKQATKFLEGIMSDALCSYGDVAKAYKAKLTAKLLEGFENFDFIKYSKSLTDLIEAELNKSIIEFGIAPAKQMIQSFVGNLEKKEWKLSEIINKFKENEVIPDEHGQSGEIAFIYEVSDYGTIYIGFDKETKDKNKRYQCDYHLMIDKKDGKLYPPHIEGKPIHPITEGGGLYGFDLFLFKLYAMNCTIICDPDNVETEWDTYSD